MINALLLSALFYPQHLLAFITVPIPLLLTPKIQDHVLSALKTQKCRTMFSEEKKKLHSKFENLWFYLWCLWWSCCKEFRFAIFRLFSKASSALWGSFVNFKEQGDFIAPECSAVYAPEQSKRHFWNPTVSCSYLQLLLIPHKIKWDEQNVSSPACQNQLLMK